MKKQDLHNNEKLLPYKEWLSVDEVITIYGIPRSTQVYFRKYKNLPFAKLGKFIRYQRSALNAWLEAHTHRA